MLDAEKNFAHQKLFSLDWVKFIETHFFSAHLITFSKFFLSVAETFIMHTVGFRWKFLVIEDVTFIIGMIQICTEAFLMF